MINDVFTSCLWPSAMPENAALRGFLCRNSKPDISKHEIADGGSGQECRIGWWQLPEPSASVHHLPEKVASERKQKEIEHRIRFDRSGNEADERELNYRKQILSSLVEERYPAESKDEADGVDDDRGEERGETGQRNDHLTVAEVEELIEELDDRLRQIE